MNRTLRVSVNAVATTLALLAATQSYAESQGAEVNQDTYSNDFCVNVVYENGSKPNFSKCTEVRGNSIITETKSNNIAIHLIETVTTTYTYSDTGVVFNTKTRDYKKNALVKDGQLHVSKISQDTDSCVNGTRIVVSYDYQKVGGQVVMSVIDYSVEEC